MLIAERRVAEVEEDQLQKEQELNEAMAQLRERKAVADQASTSGKDGSGSSGSVPPPLARSRSLQGDLEVLLKELDEERRERKGVEGVLAAAQGHVQQLEQQLAVANARIAELEAQLDHLQLKQQQQQQQQQQVNGMHASVSTSSLTALEAGLGGETGDEVMAAAQRRISALKASRDKLIAALDGAQAEVERLTGENAALAEVRESVCGWVRVLGEGGAADVPSCVGGDGRPLAQHHA
jgi:chromosome segregation ATPase